MTRQPFAAESAEVVHVMSRFWRTQASVQALPQTRSERASVESSSLPGLLPQTLNSRVFFEVVILAVGAGEATCSSVVDAVVEVAVGVGTGVGVAVAIGVGAGVQDETGRLWERPMGAINWRREDEPLVMVEVLNSTPEADGTRKTYFLRVPPTTRTAREGVAWTFGLTTPE